MPPNPPCCGIPEDCGEDPTPDLLGCESYPPCGRNFRIADKTVFVGSSEASWLKVAGDGGRSNAGNRRLSVPVLVANAEDLLGFSFTMEYDAELLSARMVDNTGLVTEGFDFFVGGVGEPGVVKVIALSDLYMGDGVERLPAGEHEVARIVFEEKATGQDATLRVVESIMAIDGERALNHHVVVEGASVPTGFRLSQNYPNPFNPQTRIRYALPENAQVSLVVYNVAGQEIETLVSERHEAGYHECVWNGNERSSGIYFYRISAGDFVETRRMVLLK